MPYVKTTFVNNSTPAINATELNKIGDGISTAQALAESNDNRLDIAEPKITKNTADIATLVSGETLKGAWTPTAGTEYPTSYATGNSWYISNLSEVGYTFTAGDLVGKTTQNLDKLIRTATGWSLIENNLTVSIPNKAIGNINNPLLDLPLKNSLALNKGVGSVTFTRSSTATFIDRYGVLKSATIDEARFEKEGLLIEGSSTNLCLHSEDFTNAAWAVIGAATKTSTAEISPSGSANALLLSGAEGFSNRLEQVIAGSSGVKYTASIWVKMTAGVDITLLMFDGANNTNTVQSTGTWQRVSVTASGTSTQTSISLRVYHGTGTFAMYIWGGQLEALPFSTSYIPTTTAAVTRNADSCLLTAKDNMPLVYGDGSSKTLIIDYAIDDENDTLRERALWATDGYTIAGQIKRSWSTSGTFYNGGSCTIYYNLIGVKKARLAFVYDEVSNVAKLYKDGVFLAQQNGVFQSQTLGNNISLGGTLFGRISNFRIYNQALTASEIALA